MRQSKIRRSGLAVGRLSLSAALAAVLSIGFVNDAALAGPDRPRVRRGDVEVTQRGDRWIIRASDGSVIHWRGFDIGRGQIVRFVQPGEWARVLNRVMGDNPTLINGILRSNGQVYIVNPAGVVFSRNSVVNVGGLYAAAGSISTRDFENEINRFQGLSGDVQNQGTIFADEAHLIGKHVSNEGTIQATGGIITMVAGDQVMIQKVGERIRVMVDGTDITDRDRPANGDTAPDLDAEAGVSNTGNIDSARGRVVLGAGDMYALGIHNRGTIQAARGDVTIGAADGAIHNQGRISAGVNRGHAGSVVVQGPTVVNEGEISADSDHGRAGYAEVTSQQHTYLLDGSRVSAAGGEDDADGGEVLIHSYQGLTGLAEGAQVDVSGGDGGGFGGFVEVSGANLILNGDVDASSVRPGGMGTILFDPRDIIVDDVGTHDVFAIDGEILFFDIGFGDITISDEVLEGFVGNIILQAQRDIIFRHPVHLVNGNNVTLDAWRHIIFDSSLTGANDLTITADWDLDGVGSVFVNAPLTGMSGSAYFRGHRIFLNASDIVTAGQQSYMADVVLETDVSLTGSNIRLIESVNDSVFGAHSLSTFGNLFMYDEIGTTRPLASIESNGNSYLYGSVMRTTGDQTFNGPVNVWMTTHIVAPDTYFADRIDAATFVGNDSLIIHGNAIFDGPIGATHSLLALTVKGATELGAGEVWTKRYQRYLGPVTLTSDNVLISTRDDAVYFGDTLDGAYDLMVRTGGMTGFAGVVGGIAPLRLLHTDTPGFTNLHADVTSAMVNFHDTMRLHADAALTGTTEVMFGQQVTGQGFDLTVNSPSTVFGGDVRGVGSLVTDADGTTLLFGDVFRGESFGFHDDVEVRSGAIMNARSDVDFGGTVEGPAGLEVIAGGRVTFGDNIGSVDQLMSLGIKAGDVITFEGEEVRVDTDLMLNGGRFLDGPAVAHVAGVGDGLLLQSSDGRVLFSGDNRLSVLGDLRIQASEVLLSDVSTLGDMEIDADAITIQLRGPSAVLNASGGSDIDGGVNFVSGGKIEFSVVPTLLGSGASPVFAPGLGESVSPTLVDFDLGRPGLLAVTRFFFGDTVLDLTPIRGGDDLAEGLPTSVRERAQNRVRDRVLLDPFTQRNLARMGVLIREMTNGELVATTERGIIYNDAAGSFEGVPATLANRLDRSAVLSALQEFVSLYYGDDISIDADLSPLADRTPQIRAALSRAWSVGQDFVAIEGEGSAESARAVESLRRIVTDLRVSGLGPIELARSHRTLLEPVVPNGATVDAVVQALEGAALGG